MAKNILEIVEAPVNTIEVQPFMRVGLIGTGECGGTIVDKACATKNFPAIAINISAIDIKKVKHAQTILIGDNRGTGKDVEKSAKALQDEHQKLFASTEFRRIIDNNDVIVVISSTGGGSGSGMAPILYDILKLHCIKNKLNKQLIIIGVLPTDEDGYMSYKNTDRFITNAFKGNKGGKTWMAYDNNKYRHLNMRDRLSKVNDDIIEDLCVLRGDYNKESFYGGIDETDYERVVSKSGRLLVAGAAITNRDIYNKPIAQKIIENTVNNHSSVDLDIVRSCSGMLSFINASQESIESFDGNMKDIYKFYGEPILTENFTNRHYTEVYESQEVKLVISGLPVIKVRHDEIIDKLEAYETKATNIYTEPSFDDVYRTVSLQGISTIVDEQEEDEESGEDLIESIFQKYIK